MALDENRWTIRKLQLNRKDATDVKTVTLVLECMLSLADYHALISAHWNAHPLITQEVQRALPFETQEPTPTPMPMFRRQT
jgi:hypothetical protein